MPLSTTSPSPHLPVRNLRCTLGRRLEMRENSVRDVVTKVAHGYAPEEVVTRQFNALKARRCMAAPSVSVSPWPSPLRAKICFLRRMRRTLNSRPRVVSTPTMKSRRSIRRA
jgi:hypothetical protein